MESNMAREQIIKHKRYVLWVTTAITVVLIVVVAVYCVPADGTRHNSVAASVPAAYLDMKTKPYSHLQIRAAKQLAQGSGNDAYIILVLCDDRFAINVGGIRSGDYVPVAKGNIAMVLENIRPDASPAVLLAVTSRLTDEGVGRYSMREGIFPVIRISECTTKPLREIAHDTLVRILKCDLKYDRAAWELEIMKRAGTTQPFVADTQNVE